MFGRAARRNPCVVGVELDESTTSLAIVYDSDDQGIAACMETPIGDLASEIFAAGLSGAACNIVLSPGDVMIMQSPKPSVPEEEVDEALRWSIRDALDFPVDDAVIEHFDVPEDALRGKSPVANVVVARRGRLLEELQLVRSAGLVVNAIDVPELALRNLLSRYVEPGKTIGLLLVETNRSIMLLFKDELLYLSRTITIDPSIASGNFDQGALDQLCLEIQRSQDYLESQLGQAPPSLMLIAAGAATHALAEAVDANMGLRVEGLTIGELGAGAADALESPAMLRAFGAALRGVDR